MSFSIPRPWNLAAVVGTLLILTIATSKTAFQADQLVAAILQILVVRSHGFLTRHHESTYDL